MDTEYAEVKVNFILHIIFSLFSRENNNIKANGNELQSKWKMKSEQHREYLRRCSLFTLAHDYLNVVLCIF